MVVKTYSYHVYQPKAKSKQGRFVDLDSKPPGSNGRTRKLSKDVRASGVGNIAAPDSSATVDSNSGLTPQLFAATHQAILKSQQQQAQAAAAAAANFSSSQYTFTTFKMKSRTSQVPAKRTSQLSSQSPPSSASQIPAGVHAPGPLPIPMPNFYGQQPLAIRPLLLPDLGMLPPLSLDSLPPLTALPLSDPLTQSTASLDTLPSTPVLSGTVTPSGHHISSNQLQQATLSTSTIPALHGDDQTVLPASIGSALSTDTLVESFLNFPSADDFIMSGITDPEFTGLTELQQLEFMNNAVASFSATGALIADNLHGLGDGALSSGSSLSSFSDAGADSALSVTSIDTFSTPPADAWDTASMLSGCGIPDLNEADFLFLEDDLPL